MTHDDRHHRILRKYGLTDTQYQVLLGRSHCPLCLKPYANNRLPCIDHDHHSGLVRGILCADCNYAIGARHDNAAWFRRAADYLDQSPAPDLIGHHFVPGSIGASRDR